MPEKAQAKPITPVEVVVIGNRDKLADALAEVWAEAVENASGRGKLVRGETYLAKG